MIKKIKFLAVIIFAALLAGNGNAQTTGKVWSSEKANEWYKNYGWLSGCDFIPSTAVNQLEMWQKETFDSVTIDRELGYAQSVGLNCMRVFLHNVAWQVDSTGFKQRMNTYLDIAGNHKVITIFVFFDDCWNATYQAGIQPAPRPGIHNSGWVRDPGQLLYDSPMVVKTLERYVKSVLTTFKNDKRILLWDLYNEPGNSEYGNKSLVLLKEVFRWSREVNPDQPLSVGVWNQKLIDLNTFQLANSDVITYHNYEDAKHHQQCTDTLQKYGRPVICTEYMARPRNSTFFNIMPLLKKKNIGAINWGLVAGKTNTKYAWDTPMPDGAEPKIWFHEIFKPDGAPYDKKEARLIKKLTKKSEG